jgi:hypothetical protein
MTDLHQQFLSEFGDGEWHELDDIEIALELEDFAGSSLPDTLLQAIERTGIISVERGDVLIDLGKPSKVTGEWVEDLVWVPGFRVVTEKPQAE